MNGKVQPGCRGHNTLSHATADLAEERVPIPS